ncbi:hypothetical protein [Streptomyces sp. NPDC127118]|uniref:hypothetical protein n=1 Tax=Streptomyces sp. NPDC127118 TaxID=3345369 RepID=UPI00363D3339
MRSWTGATPEWLCGRPGRPYDGTHAGTGHSHPAVGPFEDRHGPQTLGARFRRHPLFRSRRSRRHCPARHTDHQDQDHDSEDVLEDGDWAVALSRAAAGVLLFREERDPAVLAQFVRPLGGHPIELRAKNARAGSP